LSYPAAMPCPCCLGGLISATDKPDPRGPIRPGDLYCARCAWLFAREMTLGEDPLKLGVWLRCPQHQGRREEAGPLTR
jgi:hypothetical protein